MPSPVSSDVSRFEVNSRAVLLLQHAVAVAMCSSYCNMQHWYVHFKFDALVLQLHLIWHTMSYCIPKARQTLMSIVDVALDVQLYGV